MISKLHAPSGAGSGSVVTISITHVGLHHKEVHDLDKHDVREMTLIFQFVNTLLSVVILLVLLSK